MRLIDVYLLSLERNQTMRHFYDGTRHATDAARATVLRKAAQSLATTLRFWGRRGRKIIAQSKAWTSR